MIDDYVNLVTAAIILAFCYYLFCQLSGVAK